MTELVNWLLIVGVGGIAIDVYVLSLVLPVTAIVMVVLRHGHERYLCRSLYQHD